MFSIIPMSASPNGNFYDIFINKWTIPGFYSYWTIGRYSYQRNGQEDFIQVEGFASSMSTSLYKRTAT